MHSSTNSFADLVARLKSAPDQDLRPLIESLSEAERHALPHLWGLWGRPDQFTPAGAWRAWLILAGRGWGKTRTGAEWVREQVESARCGRIALVARTAPDARDTMVEGESGILAISPPWFRPVYEPSRRRLRWPNGAMATTYSAEEPDRLRGPQHDAAWSDELASWKYPETFDQLQFGLRLGKDPRQIITTTPRPTRLIKELAEAETTHVTRGKTQDNQANLARAFIDAVMRKYAGTRLGRQELDAEILDDNPAALWQRKRIDELRITLTKLPRLKRVAVGIDPAVTSDEHSNETGIIVGALGEDDHAYILADRSLSASPDKWASAAVKAYYDHKADRIIAEVNNGGDLVESVVRTVDRNVSYKAVHASRGKYVRAEPIAALYEQGRVHHVGTFADLEDQMCEYDPLTSVSSPDRMDALVWVLTELMGSTNTGLLDFIDQQAREKRA